jgi:hypothetical protein
MFIVDTLCFFMFTYIQIHTKTYTSIGGTKNVRSYKVEKIGKWLGFWSL